MNREDLVEALKNVIDGLGDSDANAALANQLRRRLDELSGNPLASTAVMARNEWIHRFVAHLVWLQVPTPTDALVRLASVSWPTMGQINPEMSAQVCYSDWPQE
ncbi:MAG: hypothetical protein JWQ11_2693 [Rhizobacter sp.]|nr:hypothetical protein [Rhizobacter sp.]